MKEFINRIFNAPVYETIADMNVYIRIGIAIMVIIIGWLFGLQSRKLFNSRLRNQFQDPLLAVFLSNVVRIVITLMGILLALKIIGLAGIATSVLAGAGISAFIIGFALKDIGENFLAGILLAFKRPFRVGDMIECQNIKGRVTALNLRDTELRTADGKEAFLPNSMLIKNPFLNYTIDGKLRYDFNIRLLYETDYVKAKTLIERILDEYPHVLKDELKPTVHITELGSSGIVLTIYFWQKSEGALSASVIKTDLMQSIIQQFTKQGLKMGSRNDSD